jgi:glycosyltransferase involved in cell wall biosynthesis
MPDTPRVSVVMPVYNAAAVVGKAIESILNQTFKDFEFIIVNDGSTDKTGEILREYAACDDRIKLYEQENSGLIATLNRYCRMATGRYIARMDADDISLPARLEKQFRFLEDHPEIGVLGTWIQDIDERGRPGTTWPVPSDPAVIQWFLLFGNCIAHASVMMRCEVLERAGYYRPEALHVEDYDLWIRVSEFTNVAIFPEVLTYYRLSKQSVSGRNRLLQDQHALQLRRTLTGRDEEVSELYRAYTKRVPLTAEAKSEIALDVIRRLWLEKRWLRLLRFVPAASSLHGIKKTISIAAWVVKSRGKIRREFDT